MRCFRGASFYSSFPVRISSPNTCISCASIIARRRRSCEHGGVAYCSCQYCGIYRHSRSNIAARRMVAAPVVSTSHMNALCLDSARRFHTYHSCDPSVTASVSPSGKRESASPREDVASASPASRRSNRRANTSRIKGGGGPSPSGPPRAARHVTLRTNSSDSPSRPFPASPKFASSVILAAASSPGQVKVASASELPPPKVFISYPEKFEMKNEQNDGDAFDGRDGRTRHNGYGVPRSRRDTAQPSQGSDNNSPLPPFFRTEQNEQRQPQRPLRPQSTRQPPPKPFSVPRARRDLDIPGGELSNTRAVSALLADIQAERRVLTMLKSDQRRADPGCILTVSEPVMYDVPRTTLKRCVLRLRVPGTTHDVLAIGQSTKSKLARILCFMHAEQLLDFMSGQDATEDPNAKSVPPLSYPAWPPPLEERKVTGTMVAPKERDFVSWDEYVEASEAYVKDIAARSQEEALLREQVPRSGHPVADCAAELLRRHPRQYRSPQALSELNSNLRDGSQLIHVAHLASKVFVATLKLDPQTGLTATGVAKNSKNAKRECAAHALCILQLLQQDAEGRPQDSMLAPTTIDSKKCAPRSTKKKCKKEKGHGSATQHGSSLDAVLKNLRPSHKKLLEFFNLLFDKEEMSPMTTFTRETAANGSVLYHCQMTMGDITCAGKGVNRFEAERSAMDDGITELLLYDERLQALQSFIDAYPSIAPESIPSAALPRTLAEHLRQQLQPVVQRQLAAREKKRTAATISEGTENKDTSDSRAGLNREEEALLQLSERTFAADPIYCARMQEALLALRQHPAYLSKFHLCRSTLAMSQVRQQILDAIQHHRVTVICGTTGCGKTTQVPQYILDHEIEQRRGGSCNILVTQPRRLSSFSVADRIAQERLSVVGKDVGYAVRLDARPGRHITICTTGVLLQIFSVHPDLDHVSHLIIDEVHERDINCDVVLALVKELLTRNSRLRVVLMSATMQSDIFAKYFGADTPVIQVDGAVYPVSVRYLEDIAVEAAPMQFYSPNFDAVSIQQQSQGSEDGKQTKQLLTSPRALWNKPLKTDYNLIAYLVHRAVQVDLGNETAGKSILVFLPGWKEMVSAKAAIEHYSGPYAVTSAEVRFHFILLHSTVDSAKQRECFVPAPAGMMKVVLATNIAESGITIDDAAVVIDTGLIKTTTWARRPAAKGSLYVPLDPDTNSANISSRSDTLKAAATSMPVFSTQLTLGYASQANGTQRKGRAGRTQGGVCYRLYTKRLWDALPAFPEADIHRVPLTQVLLKLLSLGYAHPKETLQTFLEPPSSTNVEVSMRLLRDIGAVDETEKLTPLGEYLAKLPCDPRIGKMIIMGAVLRCLDSVLTVAACADVSPYMTSREQAGATRKKRYLLARNSQSDHISFLNAYNAYCANGEKADFAHFNLLCLGNLGIISKYKAQYRDILLQAGLISEYDVLSWTEGSYLAETDGVEDDDADILLSEEGANAHSLTSTATASSNAAAPTRRYHGELFVDTSELSCNSFDVSLVKACVCAALFPNVAVLRPLTSNTGSALRRRRQAEKIELRTKHFTSIKPSKESACRQAGGPREHNLPSCVELVAELSSDANGGGSEGGVNTPTVGGSSSPPTPAKTVPALFYVFQDVFGVKEARQEFLTTVSAVSLWALLLFGASESTVQHYPQLSLCVIDGWIAVHIDEASYLLVTELRQALYTCLHDKYHHPKDEVNNTALRGVTEMCQAVLKAPVLPLHSTAEDEEVGQANGDASAATHASRLVDTGSIIDPLALVRLTSNRIEAGGAGSLVYLGGVDDDDASQDLDLENDDAEEEDEKEGIVF